MNVIHLAGIRVVSPGPKAIFVALAAGPAQRDGKRPPVRAFIRIESYAAVLPIKVDARLSRRFIAPGCIVGIRGLLQNSASVYPPLLA
ncbi:hypothetical protein PIIN_11012 [Serendipita indica DSM 11827]|uniref:Uncharacterized protein n=1 Tax=Serendipita indica (strain DSM 11827) TaxID=1109443 RepID=G4U0D4_SERID|nr:hypothetical protein PIIN_11012 [Serendipita indica DSM 11827]